MPKIATKLEEYRDYLINELWKDRDINLLTIEDIGIIFHLSTSTVYKIIKESNEPSVENTE